MIPQFIPYYSLEFMHKQIRSEMERSFAKVLDNNWFVLGDSLLNFEKEFSEYIEVKQAIGVGSGYDALKISLVALDLQAQDEVLVPAHTFTATILAIMHAGMKPVLIDADPDTYAIDVAKLEGNINERTRAILPVHIYGNPCNMDRINKVALHHGLYIIEDFAQSVGSDYHGKKTGSLGLVNAASFYPAKAIGALGDGGIITTNDSRIADTARKLRNYGFRDKYNQEMAGFNSRLDEIQASLISIKLKYIEKWIADRKKIALRYIDKISGDHKIRLPFYPDNIKPNYHIFPIRTEKRDQLQAFLDEKGIGTQVHYPLPPHLQQGLKDLGYKKNDFPVTETIAKTTLSLPIYPGLGDHQVDYICEMINEFGG